MSSIAFNIEEPSRAARLIRRNDFNSTKGFFRWSVNANFFKSTKIVIFESVWVISKLRENNKICNLTRFKVAQIIISQVLL